MLADKYILTSNDWLTDRHVNAANKLLLAQFPSQNGLQDPLLLVNLKKYNSSRDKFVQVINVNNQHWICISNKLCSAGVVEVFDTLPHLSKNSETVYSQVATILRSEDKSFTLNHIDVQRQFGSNDCALFSIAFATNLCFGEDPHQIGYLQSSFRPHLLKCLEKKQLAPFPSSGKRRLSRKRLLHTRIVNIYCTCRQPEGNNMAKCHTCKEWFHRTCVDIKQSIFEDKKAVYNCKLCLGH